MFAFKFALFLLAMASSLYCSRANAIEVEMQVRILSGGSHVSATVFTFSPDSVEFRTISADTFRRRTAFPLVAWSSVQGRSTLLKFSRGEALLVNGGYSLDEMSRPAGLLVENNVMISTPVYARYPADINSSCNELKRDRYKLSGLICMDPHKKFYVGEFTENNWVDCSNAVQVGPVLVSAGGHVGVCKKPDGEVNYVRSAICLTTVRNGGQMVRVVITNDPISLFDLATWLVRPESLDGGDCDVAVNLPGSSSAGAVYVGRPSTGTNIRPFLSFAKGSFTQSSFLLFSAW